MYLILGGTGNVGAAVANALLSRGEPVTILTRDAAKAHVPAGSEVAAADVHDAEQLRRVLRQGSCLFLLNPPAPPSGDPDVEERRSFASVLAALDGSGLEKVVAQSTYGAQPGEHLGDLGVLYEMEQALAAQSVPVTVLRGAYYMSNWKALLQSVREQGMLPTFYPENFSLPMVAPQDIGQMAARLLVGSTKHMDIHHVEGPQRYTPGDVAAAFAAALNRKVEPQEVPRSQWLETLQKLGFSDTAARSFANMTAATLEGNFPAEGTVERGTTSLDEYIKSVVDESHR